MAQTFHDWVSETGLSSAQLARAIGRSVSTCSELVAGRRWPDSTTVAAVYRASDGRVTHWDVALHMAVRQPRRRGTPTSPNP